MAPSPNIPSMPIFLVAGICSRHSIGTGSTTTSASITRFVMPAIKYAKFSFAQLPPGMVLSQLNDTGLHKTNASRRTDMKYKVVSAIVP